MTLNNFDEFIDKTDYLQTRLLQVNSCGSERVVKYDYTILRSNGRRDFHFLYLQNGWLDIEVLAALMVLTMFACAAKTEPAKEAEQTTTTEPAEETTRST